MPKDESRLILPNRLESLHCVQGFAREKAAELGFSKDGIKKVELILEEAICNVLDHAYQPEEETTYEVIFRREPGKLVIGVEDHGLPFDLESAREGALAGVGLRLAGAFADELHFVNLGRRGKRVEIVKNLPAKDVSGYLSEEERAGTQTDQALAVAEVQIRPAGHEDAVGVSRCVYRTYGYSDPREFIYYPERFREMLASGLVESRVAVTQDGEVAGAWFINRTRQGSPVGETGRGIVDPRFRGRHLFEAIVREVLDGVRAAGMYGLVTRPVTNHPYSQKALIPFGAAATAVLLAYVPESVVFRAMTQERLTHRQTVLVEYLKLADGPKREVHAPQHHAAMIRRIFGGAGLSREFHAGPGPRNRADLPERTRLNIHAMPDLGQAHVAVAEYGRDFEAQVRLALEKILSGGYPVTYLDLPLENPWTATMVAPVEALGLSFAGVVPELSGGDVLTFQHVTDRRLDRSRIEVASDFGKELFEYVWKRWQEAAPKELVE